MFRLLSKSKRLCNARKMVKYVKESKLKDAYNGRVWCPECSTGTMEHRSHTTCVLCGQSYVVEKSIEEV